MRRRPASKTTRGGWQLIELSMVISVLAMLTVATTKAIMGLMSIEARAGEDLHNAESLARLTSQWREDAHRATNAAVVGDKVIFSQHGDVIATYTVSGGTLTREAPVSFRRRPASQTWQGLARQWTFEIAEDGRLASIVQQASPALLSAAGAHTAPPRSARIDAALGLLLPAASAADAPGGQP
jgi:hypothetical protein